MSLAVLTSLRDTSCTTLAWIDDATTCDVLDGRLDTASVASAASDVPKVRSSLNAFITELEARHDSTGSLPVNHNAYWMLRTNALFLRNGLPAPACEELSSRPFFARITYDAGTLEVWNNANNLYVKYNLANQWTMSASRLAVATDVAGIPVDANGVAVTGQFPYSSSHSNVTEYTYTISLASLSATPGTDLYIAANATVFRSSPGTSQGWGDGTRFTMAGDHWGMYFLYTVASCQ